MSQTYRYLESGNLNGIGTLNLAYLRRVLQATGVDCTWEKAQPCPCYRIVTLEGADVDPTSSTQPQGGCPACHGDGWLYYGSQTTRVQIASSSSRLDNLAAAGLATPGSVMISAFVETPINIGDRFTVLCDVRPVVQQQIRGSGATDTLRFPIVDKAWTLGTALDPKVPETVTLGVDYAVSASLTTGAIVGGATPTEYREGVNFTISSGLINWTIGGANVPPTGARYSLRYYARPRFIVSSMQYATRQQGFPVSGSTTTTQTQMFWRGVANLESLGDAS